MNEHRSKLPPQDAEEIQKDLQELKDAINANDPDKLKEAIEKAKNAAMKIGKAMYSGAGAGAGAEQQQQQNQQEGGEQQQQQGDQQQQQQGEDANKK